MSQYYEQDQVLAEYLNFHYRGDQPDYLPLHSLPDGVLDYPASCAELVMEYAETPGRVLDLGCAVGRSCFELSRHFQHVLGVDFSEQFILTAQELQTQGSFRFSETIEGHTSEDRKIVLDPSWNSDRVNFEVGDACSLRQDIGNFDGILMANLLCRLADPAACLKRVASLLNPGGALVLTTPCSWDAAYTEPERWMDARAIQDALGLECLEETDMPFVLREHQRKAQFTVARLTVWKK